MKKALIEAQKAYQENEVPIGAIIVYNDEIIAAAHNEREKRNSALGHAEIIAIEQANKHLNSWRLDSCTMYVTIEPCPMCAGAIIQSRIQNVIYGAIDMKAGSHQSVVTLFDKSFNHKVNILGGIMEQETSKILTDFFKELREQKN